MDNPELEKRIAEETAKIEVKSYQKAASLGGWSASGRTLWAISTIGAVTGALMGALAPLIPVAVGVAALPSLAVIGTSVAAFAATGLVMGLNGGLMLGRISGSIASVAEESERRAKEWTTRQLVAQNPEVTMAPDAPKEPAPKKSFGKRLRDAYYTYCNPRVGLVMAAIGLAGGLILGAAFVATGGAAGVIMPALGAITSIGIAEGGGAAAIAAAAPAIMAYSAGVGALFGAVWNFNFPKITSEVTHFYGKLINGDYTGRKWEPPKEPAQTIAPDRVPAVDIPSRSFADFRTLVAQQEAQRANDLLTRN